MIRPYRWGDVAPESINAIRSRRERHALIALGYDPDFSLSWVRSRLLHASSPEHAPEPFGSPEERCVAPVQRLS